MAEKLECPENDSLKQNARTAGALASAAATRLRLSPPTPAPPPVYNWPGFYIGALTVNVSARCPAKSTQ